MLIGPQGPPWWIFFQIFFKNVLVYPQLTQKYVLWHSKLEKSILGRRELRHYAKQVLTLERAFSMITNLQMELFEALLYMPRLCACNAGMRAVGSLQRSYLILPSRGPHLLITVPPSSHVVNLLHIVFPLIVASHTSHAPVIR